MLVNGVAVDPAPGAAIVVYTQANKIVSSNAAMTVGGIPLQNKTGFSLDTRPVSGGEIPSPPWRACPVLAPSAGLRCRSTPTCR